MKVTPPAAQANPPLRTIAGRYRVKERLGSGGMAEVYRAHDEVLGREVAIKLLAPHLSRDVAAVERFKQEARVVGSLAHDHVVPIFDAGFENGQPFLVLQLVEGITLRELLRERQVIAPTQAARITAEIASALDAAHAQGIVHGDVKPLNILVEMRNGEPGLARLTDFGVARTMGEEDDRDGVVYGSPAYLAPEQLHEGHSSNPRSDLYGLGVVLYEMLTGRTPYAGDPREITAARAAHPPAPPSQLVPSLPRLLDAVAMRALETSPERRYQDAASFRRALIAVLEGAGETPAPLSAHPTSRTAVPSPVGRSSTSPNVNRLGRAAPKHLGPLQGWNSSPRAALAIPVLLLIGAAVWAFQRPEGGLAMPGAPTTRAVPALAGMSVDEARAALAAVGFILETAQEPTLDTPAGAIVTQKPAAGETVSSKSAVTAVVSSGVTVPGLVGRQCAEARASLAAQGWTVRPVRWRIANVAEFGNIVSQEPEPGKVLPVKQEITVNVAGPVRPC